eukprot:CAMPEP_0168432126 /NCGR_PEP_ID=MMETSP0228-20121227/38733_1 /TAXON_ID=133427 /ORGANISM="Protoceratium reticulatum, Strain CCCM 535 (=CCMP 1889)" /LENGTH=350 /DNA_ID=CAMNT_0008446249 /DNA_START=44 /DNA_END=1093 /DNA_ORIENTATION=-
MCATGSSVSTTASRILTAGSKSGMRQRGAPRCQHLAVSARRPFQSPCCPRLRGEASCGAGPHKPQADKANPTCERDGEEAAAAAAALGGRHMGMEDNSLVPHAWWAKSQNAEPGDPDQSSTLVGKQQLLRSPAAQLVRHETLVSWSSNAAEDFDFRTFAVELVGQALWHILGPLSLPMCLPLYGFSINGLSNRAMWLPLQSGKGFGIGAIAPNVFMAALMLASTTVILWFQPEHTTVMEVVVLYISTVLRCLTIAIKYGFMPRAVWNQMNAVSWDRKRLTSLMLLGSWLDVNEAFADMQIDLSLMTTVGLANEDLSLTFLQPSTAESARDIQALQGRTTRRLVAEVLRLE